MHWGILWLSLVVSAILALLFVKLTLLLGLKEQLTYIVPLLPVFYAGVFPLMEKTMIRTQAKKEKESPVHLFQPPRDMRRWSGKLTIILSAAAVSMFIQMAIDICAWEIHRHFMQGLPYMPDHLSPSSLAKPFTGGLIALEGGWKFSYLWFEMLTVSFFGGAYAGYFSKSNPLQNGLLAGVIVSMWTSAHQFLFINEQLSALSTQISGVLGLHHFNGMIATPFLQIFLFTLWSGLAYRHKTAQTTVKVLMP